MSCGRSRPSLKEGKPSSYRRIFERSPVPTTPVASLRHPHWNNSGAFVNAATFAYALLLQKEEPRKALHVGCRRGWIVHHLRQLGVQAVGIEYDADAVRHSICQSMWGDLREGLPFDDKTFELVICLGVLSRLEPWDAGLALRELRRICNGFLWSSILCTYPSDKSPLSHGRHHNIVSPAWWRPAFRRAGWKEYDAAGIIKRHGLGGVPEQWVSVWEAA